MTSPYVFPGISVLDQHKIRSKETDYIVHEIMAKVSYELQITSSDMKGKCRKRETVEARQIAISFIFENTDLSLQKIGNIFGGRNHATVIYSKNTFDDLYATDKLFKIKVDNIKSKLNFKHN